LSLIIRCCSKRRKSLGYRVVLSFSYLIISLVSRFFSSSFKFSCQERVEDVYKYLFSDCNKYIGRDISQTIRKLYCSLDVLFITAGISRYAECSNLYRHHSRLCAANLQIGDCLTLFVLPLEMVRNILAPPLTHRGGNTTYRLLSIDEFFLNFPDSQKE
jgi:hypothetical protein